MRRNFVYGLAAIGTVSLLSTSSIAQSTDGVLEGVEVDVQNVEREAKQINYVGGFVGVTGDYLGSDDAKGGVAPLARIQIGKGARYAQLHATKLSVNVLDNKSWNLGPLLPSCAATRPVGRAPAAPRASAAESSPAVRRSDSC